MQGELFAQIEQNGIPSNEINSRVKEKQIQFHNLLTEEAALRIVARESGVKITEKQKPIQGFENLTVGQRASGLARITFVGEMRKFATEKNENGLVANVGIAHGGGEATLVLWNRDCREFLAKGFRKNDAIIIEDALVKNLNPLEIHTMLVTKIEKLQAGQANIANLPAAITNKTTIAKITAVDCIDIECVVKKVNPLKEFTTNGKSGKVCRVEVSDDTGLTTLVCWGQYAEIADKLQQGMAISCDNLSAKLNKLSNGIELHTTYQTQIIPSKEKAKGEKVKKSLTDLKDGEAAVVDCTVKKLLEVKPLTMCSVCNAAQRQGSEKCAKCGAKTEETIVAEAVIGDSSDREMCCSFYDSRALHLLGMKSVSPDIAATIAKLKAPEIEGKTLAIKVTVKQNNFLNALSATCREFC